MNHLDATTQPDASVRSRDSLVITYSDANVEPVQAKCIKDYVLGSCLGRGTYGKVREAVHSRTLQRVAVKILKKRVLKKVKGGMAAIYKEIDLLRKLNRYQHPSLLQLVEVIETSAKLYLVLECALGSLERLVITQTQVLPLKVVQRLFYQLLEGISFLHSRGIVHKDIKPGNLMLTATGQLKISDLGVAEELDRYNPSDLCSRGLGSPAFQPPQVARGVAQFSGFLADSWAAGVTLYVLLTSCLPFTGTSVFNLFENIASVEPSLTDIPCECLPLIRGLLCKDEAGRLSIHEALRDPWIQGATAIPLEPEPIDGCAAVCCTWCGVEDSSSTLFEGRDLNFYKDTDFIPSSPRPFSSWTSHTSSFGMSPSSSVSSPAHPAHPLSLPAERSGGMLASHLKRRAVSNHDLLGLPLPVSSPGSETKSTHAVGSSLRTVRSSNSLQPPPPGRLIDNRVKFSSLPELPQMVSYPSDAEFGAALVDNGDPLLEAVNGERENGWTEVDNLQSRKESFPSDSFDYTDARNSIEIPHGLSAPRVKPDGVVPYEPFNRYTPSQSASQPKPFRNPFSSNTLGVGQSGCSAASDASALSMNGSNFGSSMGDVENPLLTGVFPGANGQPPDRRQRLGPVPPSQQIGRGHISCHQCALPPHTQAVNYLCSPLTRVGRDDIDKAGCIHEPTVVVQNAAGTTSTSSPGLSRCNRAETDGPRYPGIHICPVGLVDRRRKLLRCIHQAVELVLPVTSPSSFGRESPDVDRTVPTSPVDSMLAAMLDGHFIFGPSGGASDPDISPATDAGKTLPLSEDKHDLDHTPELEYEPGEDWATGFMASDSFSNMLNDMQNGKSVACDLFGNGELDLSDLSNYIEAQESKGLPGNRRISKAAHQQFQQLQQLHQQHQAIASSSDAASNLSRSVSPPSDPSSRPPTKARPRGNSESACRLM